MAHTQSSMETLVSTPKVEAFLFFVLSLPSLRLVADCNPIQLLIPVVRGRLNLWRLAVHTIGVGSFVVYIHRMRENEKRKREESSTTKPYKIDCIWNKWLISCCAFVALVSYRDRRPVWPWSRNIHRVLLLIFRPLSISRALHFIYFIVRSHSTLLLCVLCPCLLLFRSSICFLSSWTFFQWLMIIFPMVNNNNNNKSVSVCHLLSMSVQANMCPICVSPNRVRWCELFSFLFLFIIIIFAL